MAQQTHLIWRTLSGKKKPDKDVQVLFSVAPIRKAILFIHGFSGDAIATWSNFPTLLPQNQKFVGHDLFFYGYDGLRADMTASACLFRDFLERLFLKTAKMINEKMSPAFQRDSTFGYDELLIVGHSLGAVIARRALLDATKHNLPWVERTKLMLYAPAHKGASVRKLALETISSLPFLEYFGGLARFFSPLIDQLAPGSDELNALLQETMEACVNGHNQHLVAKKVVVAEYEKIVSNLSFGKDPPGVTIADASHTSLCKPKAGCLEPLTCLEEVI